MSNNLKNSRIVTRLHRNGIIGCFRMGIALLGCLLLISCGGNDVADFIDDFIQEPDAEPIRATIRTAVPLAHLAAVAMEAVQGESLPGVVSASTCDAYPCMGVVLIDFDPQNLPFYLDTIDEVLVAGLWTSPDTAVLTVSFLEAYAGVPTFPVSKISTFPVVKSGNPNKRYKIVFADVDINIATEPDDTIDLTDSQIQAEIDRLGVTVYDDVELNLSMDAWVIELAAGNTPADYTDDSYTISGGGQYVGVVSNPSTSSVNVMQLALANVLISNECSLNPFDGLAVINELDVSTGSHGSFPVIATALIGFEDECNGAAQVILATGNYIASNGASIALNLNDE